MKIINSASIFGLVIIFWMHRRKVALPSKNMNKPPNTMSFTNHFIGPNIGNNQSSGRRGPNMNNRGGMNNEGVGDTDLGNRFRDLAENAGKQFVNSFKPVMNDMTLDYSLRIL